MARRCLMSDTAQPAATAGAGAGAGGSSQEPHLRWNLHGPAVKVATAGNVVVVLLFFAAIVWRLFFAGRSGQESAVAPQTMQAGDGAAARASSSGTSTPCQSPRAGGLRKEDLVALPVFVHGSSDEEGGSEGKVECAVCISELRDGDTGRLLPRCGHRFHAQCVDRWFRSHVTCPLCRAVVADGGSGQRDIKVVLVV